MKAVLKRKCQAYFTSSLDNKVLKSDEASSSKYFLSTTPGKSENCDNENNSHLSAPNNGLPTPQESAKEKETCLSASEHHRLPRTFFDKPTLALAKALLGKKLVRIHNGERLVCRIVETEGYLGVEDKACHSYGGKKTDRTSTLYMSSGTAYVYNIYGMYCCMNISSRDEGACVLLRAAEPLEGLESMRRNRGKKRADNGEKLKDHHICSGPSKLCDAMMMDKANTNQANLCSSGSIWLEEGDGVLESDIITSTRIGIEGYGQESVEKPWRFYVKANKHVSVRDKDAEGLTKAK